MMIILATLLGAVIVAVLIAVAIVIAYLFASYPAEMIGIALLLILGYAVGTEILGI